MTKEVEWNEMFNIGVDSVDKAHRKLFSIVRRLIHLSQNENNGQWACAEGIKYFKNYAIQHFTEEEAYMQSIDYGGTKCTNVCMIICGIIHSRSRKRFNRIRILTKNLFNTFLVSAWDG